MWQVHSWHIAKKKLRQKLAQYEWQHIESSVKKTAKFEDLVLRKKQLAERKANLNSAQSRLDQAKLNLKRTKILAPYDGVVINRNISLGNTITTAEIAITYASNNSFEITSFLSLQDLNLLRPINDKVVASIKNTQTKNITLLANLDDASKMAQLLIRFKTDDENQDLFLFNDFAEVKFSGKNLTAFKASDEFIRQNDTIWVKDANNTLQIKDIKIITRQKDVTYFLFESSSKEIELITSFLATPYNGMKVKSN